MPISPFRKLAPYAEKAHQQGKIIYPLNIGQPDIETPPAALDAVRNTDIRVLGYTHGAGTESYRRKLAAYYQRAGLPVTMEDIIVTTGGSEAILFAMLTCFNPGDEVIMQEPFYGTYTAFAIAAGVHIVPITARIEDNFALPPLADFERAITPRTKAIFICNPSNPTGYVYSRAELESILALCKAHKLYLISDEAYREFCYDAPYVSALELAGAELNVVLVDTISKRYSACGARVGALVTLNKEVYAAAFRFAQMRVSPPGLGMLLAEAATDLPDSYFDDSKAEYLARRDLTVARLQAMPGVVCPRPGGAFYVLAHLPVDDTEKFGQWLLESFSYHNHTVLLSPANGFYQTPGLGRHEVRIAYVINRPDLTAALDCLEHALREYPGRIESQPAPAAVMAALAH